jgi:hypothetical protein
MPLSSAERTPEVRIRADQVPTLYKSRYSVMPLQTKAADFRRAPVQPRHIASTLVMRWYLLHITLLGTRSLAGKPIGSQMD